jgi:hypothetical protein
MSVVMSGFPETDKPSNRLLLAPNVKVHTGTSLKETSNDNTLTKKINRFLRDLAVPVWFDRIELRPGDSLMTKIAQ